MVSEEKCMKKSKKNTNSQILKISYVFVGIFLCMILYFSYFQIFEGKEVINNTYNKRQEVFEKITIRGKIITENGEVLAETEVDSQGNETRVYKYGSLFSHAVGISTNGKMGIELNQDYSLLGSDVNVFEKVSNEFKGEKTAGNNVITTLDVELQEAAYNALGNYDGAIIVIEPDSGKIRAMVSKPDFDPNTIDADWENITGDEENSCLLNRATNGLYTPGSTFKIFTFLEYIRENANFRDYVYNCQGRINVGDNSVSCYNGIWHGEENVFEAFAHSCNSSFVNMGLKLDMNSFSDTCKKLFFNKNLPTKLEHKPSSFELNESSGEFEIMQTSIGQGKTLVSPLHMCMIASAIANDGVLYEPYIVSKITNHNGYEVNKYKPIKYGEIFTKEEVEILKEAMGDVVEYGTGTRLQTDKYDVYGKTGTAEIDSGDNAHSWFVGFAENDNEKVAICVVMEDMPPGSTWAVPVAGQVLEECFSE